MRKLTFIALLCLANNICLAQVFDVENERLKGVLTLLVKSYNGCVKKGFRTKYYFNDKGQAFRSEHFFKRQKRSEYIYYYDSLGSLTYKISSYKINNKEKVDTVIETHYDYDSENRIIKKTDWTSSEHFWTEIYSDFNDFNKPKKIFSYSSSFPDTSIQIHEYNKNGKLIKIQNLRNDSIWTVEILDYNKKGNLSYSLIPNIVGRENENLVIWFTRYAAEEQYQYLYNDQNQWIEKYILFNDKKVLKERRKYR